MTFTSLTFTVYKMHTVVQLALLTILFSLHGYFSKEVSTGNRFKLLLNIQKRKNNAEIKTVDKKSASQTKMFANFNPFSRLPYKKKTDEPSGYSYGEYEENNHKARDEMTSKPFANDISNFLPESNKRLSLFNPYLRQFVKKQDTDDSLLGMKRFSGFSAFSRGDRVMPFNTFSRGVEKRIIGLMSRRSSHFNMLARNFGVSMKKRTKTDAIVGRAPLNMIHPLVPDKRIFNTFSRGLRTDIYSPMYRGVRKTSLQKRSLDYKRFITDMRQHKGFNVFERGLRQNTFNTINRGIQQKRKPAQWNPFYRSPVKRNMYIAVSILINFKTNVTIIFSWPSKTDCN